MIIIYCLEPVKLVTCKNCTIIISSLIADKLNYVHTVKVWFSSTCTYIPTARVWGLIIQDALMKQVRLKWAARCIYSTSERFRSSIRRHHISKTFWTPAMDEILTGVLEDGNVHDRFAVYTDVVRG